MSASCVAVSVYVLRRREGEIELLFLRRSGGRFAEQWWPVTGTRQSGEEPQACALRELAEETGLTPQALQATDLTVPVEGGGHLRVYVAAVDASARVRLNWEHDAHQWCTATQARAVVGAFVGPIVAEAIRTFEQLARGGENTQRRAGEDND